ncbi:YcnI family protein [Pelomonas sp. KK5]|uniref:YcnI family copper-binding membrane protein n=1 Tax=Pelomonas sp. KK5 TaxID=1855730 RepID=UPI00097C50A2|nr:YcnI family protein [Pelomonas sp. KK5]
MKQHLTLALLALATFAARAHITLEQPEAPAASSYRAVFKVGHGCEGSATRQVIVTLPEGVRGAKPMPKAGWTIARPAANQISWTARGAEDQLQDDWYDEFVLRVGLPAQAGDFSFPVRQVCVQGQADWQAKLKLLPAATPATPAAAHQH